MSPVPVHPLVPWTAAQIKDEALARLAVHTPEYTHVNEGDPGVAILEVFAFMGEALAYRASLIPERNRKKFLNLLGIPVRPASAAVGVVTVTNEGGTAEVATLPGGLALRAGEVGFATRNGLDVVPLESRVVYKRRLSEAETIAARDRYDLLFQGIERDEDEVLEFYETAYHDPPGTAAAIRTLDLGDHTVDRSIWMPLLVRRGEEGRIGAIRDALLGRTITVGVVPAIDVDAEVLEPGGPSASRATPTLSFESTTATVTADERPTFHTLQAVPDADPTDALTLIQVTLPSDPSLLSVPAIADPLAAGTRDFPPTLDDPRLEARLLTWLRIRPEAAEQGDGEPVESALLRARFVWLGINAARLSQRVEVNGERVGLGTGEPDHSFQLVNTPVIPDSVTVTVDGEPWRRIDDILAAPPEIEVRLANAPPGARLLPSADDLTDPKRFQIGTDGLLRFGTGARGARPRGSVVVSYAYGGGSVGNVGIGAVNQGRALPDGYVVANPLPTWGGVDRESFADAERSIAQFLKHRDKAASVEDISAIVRRAPGIDLGRVDVLPLYHPDLGEGTPGAVTVMVIPVDPLRPEAPVPDRRFLQAVCDHLEPRRVLTTEIHVLGPVYRSLWVSIGIEAVPGEDIAIVREAVKRQVRTFLSPIEGGFVTNGSGEGWPLRKSVVDREIWVQASRAPGVATITNVRMWDGEGLEVTELPLAGVELPKLEQVRVGIGDPPDLGPILADPAGPPPSETAPRRVPVPIIPLEC